MKVAFLPVWKGNPYHQELAESLGRLGVEVSCPDSLKSFYRDYISGAEKVDLLHLHALPYLGLKPIELIRYVLFYVRLYHLKLRGLPLVWTVHDFQNHDSGLWRVEHLINRRIAHWLDALIAHGKTARQIIDLRWRLLPFQQIYVIPHGNFIRSYRNELSQEAARAALGLEASNLVFLFLGLIRPYKGVVQMVEAFRSCADSNARLIIAGKPRDESIREEVELSIRGDERIRFIAGHVDGDDVQIFMNACDVVVLPYKRIFTSGAAILAMSFGNPCIAPRAGCVVDALDEQGAVFFDSSISGDLCRAFREISANRQRLEAMGSHNLRRVAAWDWESIARMTSAVYETCVAGSNPN